MAEAVKPTLPTCVPHRHVDMQLSYHSLPCPPNVTWMQVWKELERIKLNKAAGPDNLPNRIFKEFAFEISIPMCNIISTSLRERVVPRMEAGHHVACTRGEPHTFYGQAKTDIVDSLR